MQRTLEIDARTRLNDGNAMPLLGLGVFQITDARECVAAIHAAFDCGYRHIDTAVGYQNEEQVGKAVASASLPRDEVFLTTKIGPGLFGRDSTRQCVEDSLRKLRADYIDLYLIHWPVREKTEETYETLLELREAGRIRSVGVSNFTVRRFEEQFFEKISEIPAVNQVERHPYHANNALVDYCRGKGIQAEAYSPLAQASALGDPTLSAIAQDHGKSPAQVMIRWQLQQGVAVIPKSSNPKRVVENANVFDFELTREEMDRINALDTSSSIITWRPEEDWF